MPLLFINRKLNDSISDTVDERSRHLSRLIFTNFCLAKLQDGKRFRRSTFSFDSRLVYEYLPYASTETANKSKVCLTSQTIVCKTTNAKPVLTIGTKYVLGYGQQTITEP